MYFKNYIIYAHGTKRCKYVEKTIFLFLCCPSHQVPSLRGTVIRYQRPWMGESGCPGWHQLAMQGWGLSSALLTLLLAFSLLINMSWGRRGGKAQNNRFIYLPAHLGKGCVCEDKIGQKSVLRVLKETPNCGFKFSVSIADESSEKSRFNCKPSWNNRQRERKKGHLKLSDFVGRRVTKRHGCA